MSLQIEDEIKAKAVMEFANMMIGAFDTGFIDKNNATLSEIYRVAQNHIKDSFGFDTPNIIEQWGEVTAVECGLKMDSRVI